MGRMVVVLGLAALLGGSASAGPVDLACVARAKGDFLDCRSQCKDDFVAARFLCRGVDPACGAACLAGRTVCLDNAQLPLDTCITGCNTTLDQDKMACPAPPDPLRDACVDAAQLKAFQCRDQCREDFRHDPTAVAALLNCKQSFRACVHTCPTAK